jgi:hypothetical protein
MVNDNLFQTLEEAARRAYADSTISRAPDGTRLGWSVCALPLRPGVDLLAGLNWGGEEGTPSASEPGETAYEEVLGWPFIKATLPLLSKHGFDLRRMNYVNVCPFRTQHAGRLSRLDWASAIAHFFIPALDALRPPRTLILGVSAVDELRRAKRIEGELRWMPEDTSTRGTRGRIRGDHGASHLFLAVPHPQAHISWELRREIWTAVLSDEKWRSQSVATVAIKRQREYMTHTPWRGDSYQDGINGQRIAIVGYSHWLDDGEVDSADATVDTIRKVINKELGFERISFFVQIRNYFGFETHEAFWNRVLFFNFLPECVGGPEKRYDSGTEEQIGRGRERFRRILDEYRPHKVLVFTARGWQECPPTRQEQTTNSSPMLSSDLPRFSWGTYEHDGHVVMAFGLRHPQFAPTEVMRRAINHILAMPQPSR